MNNINLVFIVISLLLMLAIITMYNGLVRARTRVREAWSDIDVQLKRRLDLIPNLINTVKGYQTHEAETLTKITDARAKALSAESIKERSSAEAALGLGLQGLFAVAENYPDLKASTNFLELQRELSDTENKIQAARRFYNGLVREYNIKIQTIPTNLLANLFGFTKADFFELQDEKARQPVSVKF